MNMVNRVWPADAAGKVPYWVYSDPAVYAAELDRIWYGPHWLFCALEAEIPEVGDFKTTTLGERPVVVVRSGADEISVLENRCAHRGVKFCQARRGHVKDLLCPYHQWNYSLRGDLQGAPFRRGVRGQGGMPADFDPKDFSLRKLRVEVVNGLVWATFSDDTPPFRTYLGERFWQHYTRVYDGRKLAVLGYNRQHIPGNWKLMQENIKDPYHASLLHVFFVTFGLFRADQKSATEVDPTGKHGILISRTGRQESNDVTAGMRTFRSDIVLADTRIMDGVKEFAGEDTVNMITVFPSVVLQQNINSLSIRQIVPTGVGGFDFHWTHWGYAEDTPEMRLRRMRQANLFGPAGFVSADDSEIIAMSQQGFSHAPPGEDALVIMGGREVESVEHMVTEVGIRGMYRYWREAMGAMITRDSLRDFYDQYYAILDDLRLEEWPALFTEDCIYRVIPRENYEAGYTLSTIYAESRGMLTDRVMGVMRTQMFAPRYYRRFPGPLQIAGRDGDSVRVRQNLLMVQTLVDRQTEIVLSAVCHDVVVAAQDRLLLRERIVVFDSEMIPNSLIYPA